MKQTHTAEGDPPGQIIHLAPYEPRDSQGRTLDVACYQDRSLREAETERRLLRSYPPLLLLSRSCEVAAWAVLCSLPFSSFALWFLLTLEMNVRVVSALFCGALLYLVLHSVWIGPALQARLKRIRADAQALGIEPEMLGRLSWPGTE